MMNKGVAIRYGDVAPEAKENFYPSVNDKADFVDLSQLQQYNLNFPNYANPCELYSVVLDGTATAFPSVPEQANLGLWSEQISNNDGTFTEPIVLELESVGQYSSQGLTLTFDTYNGIFATRLSIKWLRITDEGITTLDEKEYNPDNAFYFCRNFVENYNKVVITFYSLNMPKNRLKLRVIDYGYGTIFYGKELRNVKVSQEINPISTEIAINPTDFILDSSTDIEYSFQKKQPLTTYFNGRLISNTFVKSSKRKARFLWDIQSEDYIGIMDGVPYYGGMYFGADAYDLLVDIFTVAKVPYTINEALKGVLIYGYISFTTCREALMQVAFAVQNVADTSGREDVAVYELDDEVKQTIPLNRIKQGQNFVDDETVTGVEVTVHSYKPITETIDVYDASESGTGQNIFVKFNEPLHDLKIGKILEDDEGDYFVEDATVGEIVAYGTNYAVINANSGCILRGQQYEHTTQTRRKNNPVVLASEIEKVISVESATLVSQYNIDKIIDKCYNWLIKTNTVNLDIVEGKHIQYGEPYKYGTGLKYGSGIKYGGKHPNIVTYDEPVNVGDKIDAETEYLGVLQGKRNIKQSFNLNGNILVKKAVLK